MPRKHVQGKITNEERRCTRGVPDVTQQASHIPHRAMMYSIEANATITRGLNTHGQPHAGDDTG